MTESFVCPPIAFIRADIHSAVRVFKGEADEIAAQSFRGFCGKAFQQTVKPAFSCWQKEG
jgi:hypothetical protein